MRILIVRTTSDIVNLKNYNLQEVGLAKALTRRGHECTVAYYCGKEKDHIETLNFDGDKRTLKILWLHGYGVLREGIYPSLKKYIKDYDIIQVGGYVGFTSVWLNRHVPEKVINYQGPYYCKFNRGDNIKAAVFDKVLLPFSHKKNMVVYTKSKLATEYIKSKGINNVTTVGVGLDLDNILNSPKDIYEHEFIKSLRENKGDNRYLLYIGVLEERRNIEFLLRVFNRVHGSMKNCKLVMIGRGEKEYVDKCFSLAEELGIRKEIIYKDKLEQEYLKAVYECSDVFLLPTRYEIFGMVLLEAMYFGLPVFTTYNGGSSTLMTKEPLNGFILRELDEEKWCKGIMSVLLDQDMYDLVSENAKRTIEEGYTWDALAEKILSVYEKRTCQSES